jgi:hypothetical protein
MIVIERFGGFLFPKFRQWNMASAASAPFPPSWRHAAAIAFEVLDT